MDEKELTRVLTGILENMSQLTTISKENRTAIVNLMYQQKELTLTVDILIHTNSALVSDLQALQKRVRELENSLSFSLN